MGELHLDLAVTAGGTLGEDIQDQLRAVDDLQVDGLANGARLRRGQLLIEDDQVRSELQRLNRQLAELATPQQVLRVNLLAQLHECIKHYDVVGSGEFGELG